MRIIAGIFGGRVIDSPKGYKTHPMSEKARGALFNSLGDISSKTVCDIFAGSGALGLEALSRGAKSVIAIESDRNAHRTMSENAESLGITNKDTYWAVKSFFNSWFTNNSEKRFDIVLCDPPYDDLQITSIQKAVTLVKSGGVFVLSWPKNTEVPDFISDKQPKILDQGDATIFIYSN